MLALYNVLPILGLEQQINCVPSVQQYFERIIERRKPSETLGVHAAKDSVHGGIVRCDV